MYDNNIVFRKLISSDLNGLLYYLRHLSNETKSRFGPHPFDKDSVIHFYNTADVIGYIAEDNANNSIIAYSIVKKGILLHDSERLHGYNYLNIEKDCCTYAPSVADDWQGKGIAKLLFRHILNDCKNDGIKRIVLWGGVQSNNERAVNFYKKSGFTTLAKFEYNGSNEDMILEIE